MSGVSESRRRDWWVIGLLAAGAVLRVLLMFYLHVVDGDADVYRELGMNLFRHGVYGLGVGDDLGPALFRLPGYPIFLALHGGRYMLAELTQTVLELCSCWLLYRMMLAERGMVAARWTLGLGTLCFFTAIYAATPMTESLSTFCVALALYGLWRMLREERGAWVVIAACALAMVIRPDGVLVTAAAVVALAWHGRRAWDLRRAVRRVALVGGCSVLILVPWAVRNWRTIHVVQPLAPRHVNDPGEFTATGFYRWIRTWSVDFVSTEEVFWRAGQGVIDVKDLPARACDTAAECAETAELIAECNQTKTLDAPGWDGRFEALAEARIRRHPLRYYLWMPAARAADMWLRPRTETLEIDSRWWEWREHAAESAAAAGLGLLGLVFMVLGAVGVWRKPPPVVVFCMAYVVMRTILIGTMENVEQRYTVEAFPVLFVCAASAVGRIRAA